MHSRLVSLVIFSFLLSLMLVLPAMFGELSRREKFVATTAALVIAAVGGLVAHEIAKSRDQNP